MRAQADARAGLNIGSASNDSSGYNTTSQRRRRARRNSANSKDQNESSHEAEGLTTRKCMHQSYEIISQNDVERQGGMRDAFITVCTYDGFCEIVYRLVLFEYC